MMTMILMFLNCYLSHKRFLYPFHHQDTYLNVYVNCKPIITYHNVNIFKKRGLKDFVFIELKYVISCIQRDFILRNVKYTCLVQ